LRSISRLTVEGERPRETAIERSGCPTAIPLEISSRSASVNDNLERVLSAGRIPPDGLR
jgi:hypothetical protein